MDSLIRQFAAALVATALFPLAPAQAESYPNHAITLIVPGVAGGAADSMARRLAEHLGKRLNQTIIVEDVGGASGALAAQRVLRAAPDGYTLMFSTPSEMILSPLSNEHLKYKLTDFTPIGKIFETPMVIVARSDLNIRGVDHLVRLARVQSDLFTVGMTGATSFQALYVAALEQAAAIHFVEVPYQGGPAVLQDLLGGRVDLAVTTPRHCAAIRQVWPTHVACVSFGPPPGSSSKPAEHQRIYRAQGGLDVCLGRPRGSAEYAPVDRGSDK